MTSNPKLTQEGRCSQKQWTAEAGVVEKAGKELPEDGVMGEGEGCRWRDKHHALGDGVLWDGSSKLGTMSSSY